MKHLIYLIAFSAFAFKDFTHLHEKTTYITGALSYSNQTNRPSRFVLYNQTMGPLYIIPANQADSEELKNLFGSSMYTSPRPIVDLSGTFSYDGYYMTFILDSIAEKNIKAGPAGVYLLTNVSRGMGSKATKQGISEMVERHLEQDGLSKVKFINQPGRNYEGMVAIVTSIHSLHKLKLLLSRIHLSQPVEIKRLDLGLKPTDSLNLR